MSHWDEYEQKDRQEKLQDDFAPPSENQVLGHISWVDPKGGRAVVYLANNSLAPSGTMIARDYTGRPTALMKPSGQRRDKALGVTLPYGKPNVGDEVILRGSAELPDTWGRSNSIDGKIVAQRFPFVMPQGKFKSRIAKSSASHQTFSPLPQDQRNYTPNKGKAITAQANQAKKAYMAQKKKKAAAARSKTMPKLIPASQLGKARLSKPKITVSAPEGGVIVHDD